MSANPYNYDPLRVVNPSQYQYQPYGQQQATPQLGQMKQDTGWSYAPATGPLAGPGPLYDNNGVASHTPPGAQPAAYTGNAWQNYNDPASNAQFNYSQDPYFNAAADHPKWDLAQTGNGTETDRARVWRWTLDGLRAQGYDPGKAPQQVVQQAYLQNIGRLKNDYAANGMNWQGSAYSGYDQFLGGQGGQPSGQPATSSTDQAWASAIQNAATQPGGTRTSSQGASPVTTPNDPLNPYNTPNGSTGTQPGGTRGAVAGGAYSPNGGTSSQTSNASSGQMFYGQAPDYLVQDPQAAYQALLMKMGIDPNIHGYFTAYLQKRLGPAVQAIINSTRGNGQLPANIDDTLAQIGQQAFGQGGDWNQYTAGIADKGLANIGGSYGQTADISTLHNYIASLLALKSEGLNPVASSGMLNNFDDTTNAYIRQGLANGGKDTQSFLPYFQGTNFYKTLAGR